MKHVLLQLANHLDRLGLTKEADLCTSILVRWAKGSDAQANPYGSIATPMEPLAWAEEECLHEFDTDQCPVCGKMLITK